MKSISLSELKECIEGNMIDIEETDDYVSFIELDQFRILTIPERYIQSRINGNTVVVPEWFQDEWEWAEKIVSEPEDFLKIDAQNHFSEEKIERDFIDSCVEGEKKEKLINALNERAGSFKSKLYDYHMEDQWYEFYDKGFKDVIIKWCETNKIQFIDDIK